MWGSCSPRAVTMNWTGSDRLATSCSVYTVPSGLMLKFGSLLMKPTSLLRWQSSNLTAERKKRRSRRWIKEQHSQIYFMRCSQILDTSGRLKINPHPSRRIAEYLIPSPVTPESAFWHLRQNKLLICFLTAIHQGRPNSFFFQNGWIAMSKLHFPPEGNHKEKSKLKYISLTAPIVLYALLPTVLNDIWRFCLTWTQRKPWGISCLQLSTFILLFLFRKNGMTYPVLKQSCNIPVLGPILTSVLTKF